jgi:cephalosporin-C deacetylase-like acetyl esterase
MLSNLIPYNKGFTGTFIENNIHSSTDKSIVQEITLQLDDKSEVLAFLVKPKAKGKYPGVVFLHWLENHAENSNKLEFLPMAISLAEKNNIVSILPDAFWSTTPEKFKENPVMWWKTEFQHDFELNKRQLLDLLQVIDFFESLDIVDKNNIGFCAHDFGAMFGTLLANYKPNFKTYVLMALTGKFSDWYRFGNKLETIDEFLSYTKKLSEFDPVSNIDKINENSIYFQFALNDFYVSVEKAFELMEKAKKPYKVSWYKTGHGMNQSSFVDAEKWLIEKLIKK